MERVIIEIDTLEWVLKNAKIFDVESLSIINEKLRTLKIMKDGKER